MSDKSIQQANLFSYLEYILHLMYPGYTTKP